MKKQSHRPKSFRLSTDANMLLVSLARKLGIGQSSVVELAIRAYAQQNGIEIERSDTATTSPPPG